GSMVWPNIPMRAQPRQDSRVKPTTHGLRRRRTSDSAPRNGIATTTNKDATAPAAASSVLDTPKSSTSHTVKYNVAMFIEKMVLEKSYNAQLERSSVGARSTARISPSANTRGIACCGCAMKLAPEVRVT